MDRNAQKAPFPACSEHVGHLTAWILYHFHCCKSLHLPVLKTHEQAGVSLKDAAGHVERVHERMMLARGLYVLLDGGPEFQH